MSSTEKELDIAGNEIETNDICQVYHFTGVRNKKYYMYKQIGEKHYSDDGFYYGRIVYHLPYNDQSYYHEKDFSKKYLVIAKTNWRVELKTAKFITKKEAMKEDE